MKRILYLGILIFSLIYLNQSNSYAQFSEQTRKKIERHRKNAKNFQSKELYKKAIEEWTEIIRLYPKDYEAYEQLGICYFNRGSSFYGNAENCLLKAFQINPTSVEAHHKLGIIYYKRNNFNDAIKHLEKASEIQKDLSDSLYHYRLGISYYKQSEYSKAQAKLEQVLRTKSEDDIVHYYLAKIYYMQHRVEKAMSELNSATTLNQNYIDAHLMLFDLYSEREIQRYIESIDPSLYYDLGLAAKMEEKWTLARCLFENVLANDKSFHKARNEIVKVDCLEKLRLLRPKETITKNNKKFKIEKDHSEKNQDYIDTIIIEAQNWFQNITESKKAELVRAIVEILGSFLLIFFLIKVYKDFFVRLKIKVIQERHTLELFSFLTIIVIILCFEWKEQINFLPSLKSQLGIFVYGIILFITLIIFLALTFKKIIVKFHTESDYVGFMIKNKEKNTQQISMLHSPLFGRRIELKHIKQLKIDTAEFLQKKRKSPIRTKGKIILKPSHHDNYFDVTFTCQQKDIALKDLIVGNGTNITLQLKNGALILELGLKNTNWRKEGNDNDIIFVGGKSEITAGPCVIEYQTEGNKQETTIDDQAIFQVTLLENSKHIATYADEKNCQIEVELAQNGESGEIAVFKEVAVRNIQFVKNFVEEGTIRPESSIKSATIWFDRITKQLKEFSYFKVKPNVFKQLLIKVHHQVLELEFEGYLKSLKIGNEEHLEYKKEEIPSRLNHLLGRNKLRRSTLLIVGWFAFLGALTEILRDLLGWK